MGRVSLCLGAGNRRISLVSPSRLLAPRDITGYAWNLSSLSSHCFAPHAFTLCPLVSTCVHVSCLLVAVADSNDFPNLCTKKWIRTWQLFDRCKLGTVPSIVLSSAWGLPLYNFARPYQRPSCACCLYRTIPCTIPRVGTHWCSAGSRITSVVLDSFMLPARPPTAKDGSSPAHRSEFSD